MPNAEPAYNVREEGDPCRLVVGIFIRIVDLYAQISKPKFSKG